MLISIDPGHGGNDPGAMGFADDLGPIAEKDLNLTASLILGGLLNSYGYGVMFTRTDDSTVPLSGRVVPANDSKADIFVSIHCNSFTDDKPRGFEIYRYPGSLSGGKVANTILEEVKGVGWIELHGNNIKDFNFYVLKHTSMVAVLLELSYMSNEDDLRLLMNTDNVYELMSTVARTIDTYLIA